MFNKILRTLLISCLLTTSLFGANIIFDLGGVLIDTNKMAAFSQFGLGRTLAYTISTRQSPSNLKKKCYEVLNKIAGQEQTSVKDHEGEALPVLMCDWMTSKQSGKQILDTVMETTEKNTDWFVNRVEKSLVQTLARMMFNSKRFVQTRRLIKNGVNFVKECKKQGHKCYILSNWDKKSFELMQQKHPKFFELFDGIIISGNTKCLKPDQSIYHKLCAQHNLNPYECVFIDDQKENIVAARDVGMYAIHCKKSGNPDFKYIKTKLAKWENEYKERAQNNWPTTYKFISFLITIVTFSLLITPVM